MHKYNLQAFTKLKAPPQINFGKYLERKGCSKSSKIPKICPVFSNVIGVQSTFSDVSKNRLREKCFHKCFEMVGSLPGKAPQ